MTTKDAKQSPIALDVWDILPILRKRVRIVILFFATVFLTTFVSTITTEKEYRSSAIVQVMSKTGQEVKHNGVLDMNQRGYYELSQFYRTQIQILNSRTVRERTIEVYMELHPDDPINEGGAGAGRLAGMLLTVPVEQSQLIQIMITDTVPQRAADLANLVAKVYSDRSLQFRKDAAAEVSIWLTSQMASYEREIATANDAMLQFKEQSNLVDVEESVSVLSQQYAVLSRQHAEIIGRKAVSGTALGYHEEMLKQGKYIELAFLLSNAALQNLAIHYDGALLEEAQIKSKYGEKFDKTRVNRADLDRTLDNIKRNVREAIAGERSAYQVVSNELHTLEREIEGVKVQLLEQQKKKGKLRELKLDVQRKQAFYRKLRSRADEVHLSASTQLNNIFMIDSAVVPAGHFKPRLFLSMMIASLIGLVGGIGLALVRELIDDTISSHIDLQNLDVPYLGLVPSLPLGLTPQQADLYTIEQPRSAVAEAIRGVRAMLEAGPSGRGSRRFLVTSSIAREGKTSTVVRLAASYAQMGLKVVAIDADLRKPRLHKVFSMPNTVGLSDHLLAGADPAQIARSTIVPNLSIISAGPMTDHPVELLVSGAFERLLDKLDESYDLIIVDTPPSVALSDAVAISRYVDGVILVVRDQGVSKYIVRRTLEIFKQVDVNIIGVILNNVDLFKAGAAYKYYHAYHDYQYNYGQVDEDPR